MRPLPEDQGCGNIIYFGAIQSGTPHTFPVVRVILMWQSPRTRDLAERPSSLNHLSMPFEGISCKIQVMA